MTENQQKFALYIERAFADKAVTVMVAPKRMAIVESLQIGVQPRGKRIKQFAMAVPKREKDYPEAVNKLRKWINSEYKAVIA